MRKLEIFKVFVPALLLCISSQVVNGQGAMRNAMRGEVTKKTTTLSQYALATFVSIGLISGAATLTADAHELSAAQQQERLQQMHQAELQATMQQDSLSTSGSQPYMQGWSERLGEEDEEDNALAWSKEVTRGSGVFYLALRNPDYDHIHHVVYVGDTATGEPMFAGMFLVGHEEDYIRLYAHDGLVARGFMQRDVQIFSDPLDLYAEVTVFTIKDLNNLSRKYQPVVPEMFPVVEVGQELQMVQYGVREDDPESLFNLPIKQRSCKVLEANVWAELGIGRHTCNALEGAFGSFGAPLFVMVSGKLVGFNSGSTPVGANHAEGMTQEFVNFIIEQQTNPTAVDSKDKLAVTWGAIKKAQ